LGAVIKRLNEIQYLLNGRRFPEQCDPLRVESLGFFLNVLFLRKEKKLTIRGDLLVLAQILKFEILGPTSSIWEWRIVATAFMIESTLGFEIVVPMYMLFRVEDLRLSISSRSLASGTVNSTIYSI
jgi:hypothetical protein